jgi:hypothetical protein
MRRLVALPLVLVLAGCGTKDPSALHEAGATFSPVPAAASTPTPTPAPSRTPTAAPDPHGPLSRFPLALGYAARNGDDRSPVVVTDEPATRAFKECGKQVWDPAAGSTDVIGVEFRGESEWSRGRTLVLYPTVEAAGDALDTAREAIRGCPRDEGDATGWAAHTEIDYEVGDRSFGWIDRWWTTEVDGYDTGLVVYHVALVGRAVLLTYEYGEGNGTEESRREAISETAKADQPVVDVMRWL